jgi:hypothetical protein
MSGQRMRVNKRCVSLATVIRHAAVHPQRLCLTAPTWKGARVVHYLDRISGVRLQRGALHRGDDGEGRRDMQ